MRAAALALLAAAAVDAPPDYHADAVALDALIGANYAYAELLPGGRPPASAILAAEQAAVNDRATLRRYAEDRMASLADHHANTGFSFPDSWGLVPSYADLWVESAGDYRIDAVRADSPAARAGIVAGDRLVAVDGVPIAAAVRGFWAALGLEPTGDRAGYAARVLAAGRRDRPRQLTVAHAGVERTLTLPTLYAAPIEAPPVVVVQRGREVAIRFGNSLGDGATIAAFDAAMARVPPRAPVLLDLTDTPSGGNTSVARAIMGWFVTRPTVYQVHNLPAEERETGIARQWMEQVLPRPGRYHPGRVRVRVGRWTGSMGEGLAVGFDAIGARVCGGPMAGLRGAITDFVLPVSGLRVAFPAERLFTANGVPRERWVPRCRA